MPNLLAMSFEGELAPSFDLRCLAPGRTLPDGWGLGYYPGGEPASVVLKEPAPPQGSIRSQLAKAWEHLESSLLVMHIRAARWGAITDANTQPFCRSWGRRDWLLCHSGSLTRRPTDDSGRFEPVGSTDTEQLFCVLLGRFAERGWKSIGEIDLPLLRAWLDALDDDGGLTIALTDGRDLVVYADRDNEGSLYLGTLAPPYDRAVFADDDLLLDLGSRGTKSRKGVIVSSTPLEAVEHVDTNDTGAPSLTAAAAPARPGERRATLAWTQIPPGTLLCIRQGAVIAEHGPIADGVPVADEAPRPSLVAPSVQIHTAMARRGKAPPRTFDVVHRTVYRYAKPIERSTHVLRLTPRTDRRQQVLSHAVTISVPGMSTDFDDVFDNRVRRLFIDTAWNEMVIEARSRVRVLDVDPLDFRAWKARSTIPLVWMPWQRQIMAPYLLPPELPETQLEELSEYAMSFVKRNDFDLLDTLLDINATIFKEYAYRQNSTTLATTAFEVYSDRYGVCQDFTNLFICLARLLGVPARYVCGYIYTGPRAASDAARANTVQSEASHAWVQLYLPEVGWKGFDPTNGILTQTEHIRVAVGRNYIDATPTSGTIYVGGGPETLDVDVRVEEVEASGPVALAPPLELSRAADPPSAS